MIQQDEKNGLTEDYFSYCSSTRGNWGRCSSLVLSDEESYPDFRDDDNGSEVGLSQNTHSCTPQIMFDLLTS